MFSLTKTENEALRSQFVTLKRGEHSKYMPMAFTEQGVAMLSSVLNSSRAIKNQIVYEVEKDDRRQHKSTA
ncbi:MAG: ORF6N domain-containing protein [Bacteroidota bacterium]